MKLKLAVAFAVLSFASVARADDVSTPVGSVYIPNGSTVTSIEPVSVDYYPNYLVSFTFADGYGEVTTQGVYGMTGSLDFITPVAGLSLDWDGQYFWAADNIGDTFGFPDNSSSSGTIGWAGPGITLVNFGSGSADAGVDSMTYALDGPASVPEPSSLLLSGMGLTALIGLARRYRTKGQKAID